MDALVSFGQNRVCIKHHTKILSITKNFKMIWRSIWWFWKRLIKFTKKFKKLKIHKNLTQLSSKFWQVWNQASVSPDNPNKNSCLLNHRNQLKYLTVKVKCPDLVTNRWGLTDHYSGKLKLKLMIISAKLFKKSRMK